MSQLDPYDLHHLIQSWMGLGDQSYRPYGNTPRPTPPETYHPYGNPPGPRVEPTFPDARAGVVGEKAVGNEILRNPEATEAGEGAIDAEMDKANTESWTAKMKAAKDANVDPDKKSTKAWINKMRAAREGQKAVGAELAKPMPEGPPPDDPGRKQMEDALRGMQDTLAARGQGETSRATGAPPPVNAGAAGEAAVRNALLGMDMRPLIEQVLGAQRSQHVRDFIAGHIAANPPPELSESDFAANMNRTPGTETSYLTSHDYSSLPETFPGVQGMMNMPPNTIPRMPPPANSNPLFPPSRPPDPNLPQGPHVRSPGKPEDPPPSSE